jgi:hypothetical protein
MNSQDEFAERQQTLADQAGGEVQRLLEQIRLEYEAGMSGLSGLARGMSRHSFITARMERMGELHKELEKLIGYTAIVLVARALEDAPANTGTISPGCG